MKNTLYTSLLSIIVLFGALLPASSLAQNRPDTLSYKCFEASPRASALLRMGEYEVSHYTGLPNIDIPFYTINTGWCQVPVSFHYRGGGIKYDDISGELGLGWDLAAGGVITQEIRGMDDLGDDTHSWIRRAGVIDQTNYLGPFSDYYYVRALERGIRGTREDDRDVDAMWDGEHDIFRYSCPGGSGQFIIAPYAFCAGDPVNFVDPDGNRPIYSTEGILLGTDDNGLQGDAIIMDAQNFKQGMSPDLAAKYDLGISALSDAALVRFNKSYSSLSQRPDWDGYLTLSEANKWYRNGSGKPLFVSLEKLDLSNLSLEGKTVGQPFLVNMFKDSDNTNDALVHGVITLKMYPDRTVRAFSGTYKFYMKPWTKENFKRNIATIGGEIVAGQGRKYEINIYGSKIIP